MSEVIKRDKDVIALTRLHRTICRDKSTATVPIMTVWEKQLAVVWNDLNRHHDLVMDRSGKSEFDEQNAVYDNSYDLYNECCVIIETQRYDLSSKATEKIDEDDVTSEEEQFRVQHSFMAKRVATSCERITRTAAQMPREENEDERRRLDQALRQLQEIALKWISAGASEEVVLAESAKVDVVACAARTLLTNAMAELNVQQQPEVAEGVDDLRMPTLNIQPFDGKFTEWEAFRESFQHGIHDRKKLPAIQKLQYLKTVLRGEPEELIRNLSLSAANYISAWELLKKLYNNVRELVVSHIRCLATLPQCNESADSLRRLTNKTASTLLALKNLERPVDTWDDWVVFHVCAKLDVETRRTWEQHQGSDDDLPTWDKLDLFLQGRIRALSSIGEQNTNKSIPTKFAKTRTHHATTTKHHHSSAARLESSQQHDYICGCCGGSHLITFCDEFRKLSVPMRRRKAAERSLCFVCLLNGHRAELCNVTRVCQLCNRRHNTLLHDDNQQPFNDGQARPLTAMSTATKPRPTVILATALINVRDAGGSWHQMRALLDQGADWSLVSENVANILQLPRANENVSIGGIAGINAGRSSQSISIEINDRWGLGQPVTLCALILPRLTNHVKPAPVGDQQVWPHVNGLMLADPNFKQRQSFDILIGSEVYGTLLRPGLRQSPGLPTAQNSALGWLISGAIKETRVHANFTVAHHTNLENQLTRFWEIEEPSHVRKLTDEENKCEAFFEETVTRDGSGRIHVRLPMKNVEIKFGESQRYAVQRQLQLERRFKTNPEFAERYAKFMGQYIELGHMREVDGAFVDLTRMRSVAPPNGCEYYIPHHAVMKESSSTTKLRVVFDASRRTTNGVSLNEQMRIGPRLQEDLTALMMRWRTFRVAMCADIEKMYRQIVVDAPDIDLQRIVWRPKSDAKMKVFQLCTVTYGTAAAPYLAVKSLQTLARLEQERFPIGAKMVLENFYVDDVLGGADTVNECIMARRQLVDLLMEGGFQLRKWASNSEEVLAELDPSHLECELPLQISDDASVSTVGFFWNPARDEISVKVNIPCDDETWTKRSFLSAASSMYDPLGWLAPAIILVKILFQELWKHDLDWDDTIPSDLAKKWNAIRVALPLLRHAKIPRWIGTTTQSEIEIHGFCDASMSAYAAVVFVRIRSLDQTIRISNVCAKTKVAPIKVISLPRLELCGAVLLTKIIDDVLKATKWTQPTIHCWTDSTIVLAWLRAHPSRFNIFVANRTAEIQRRFPIDHWNHVASADNPADCASRGISPDQLLMHPLWWAGPPWLREPQNTWPHQPTPCDTSEETRANVNTVNVLREPWDLIHRFSSWRTLVRVTSWCIRFGRNCRDCKEDRERRGLTATEMINAREYWVRETQACAFHDDLCSLRKDRTIGKSSPLRSLNPFLSPDSQMICVGGRLANAHNLTPSARMPTIIPQRSPLSALLIRDAHEQTLHGGPALMLALLRRTYWIIDGPNEVRRYVNKCTVCFRYTAKPEHQLMGALPAPRVTPSRPFLHCAMDYSGAIQVRSTRGRGHQARSGYVAVFVCLATKAVHIELVGDLTTTGFIAAYERFTARRGMCSNLYSDNATNYVGAANVFLRSERSKFNDAVHAALSSKGTTWHFSPPRSPHFNGLAESAIRSVKHHIRRVVGDLTLTFEELLTVLAKIEACLNSRPLCPINNDPDNIDVLTPGHFLIGEPITMIPNRDVHDVNPSALTRWQLTHQLVQRFWRRWSSEYLHTLQQRSKWQTVTDNVRIGELVLIIDDNMPPAKWALGRIVELHPGDDGHVRVVTIRANGSTFKRSIVRVARLPVDVEPTPVPSI